MAVDPVEERAAKVNGEGGPEAVRLPESSRQKWTLTQDAFDGLLASLGPDRDAAADRYLEIRRNLVRLFEWRGCSTPDDYADETINRCARKIADGGEIRDIATYCVGVARMLLLEMARVRSKDPLPLDQGPEPRTSPAESGSDEEQRLECLHRCLGKLSTENRDLILRYYQGEKSEKISTRKGLMQLFKIPAATLRMRALRLRESLQVCSEECVQNSEGKRL